MEIYSMSAQENYVGVGGWTAYHELTPKDHAVFKEALEGFVGCNTPRETVADPGRRRHKLSLSRQSTAAWFASNLGSNRRNLRPPQR